MTDTQTEDPGIITNLPPEYVREYWDDLMGRIPQEKIEANLRQARNARIMQQAGSLKVEGLGQKVAEIDARLYFRMQHDFGHHEGWLDDFLASNPELCSPGWKPRRRKHDLRESKTFINGVPI